MREPLTTIDPRYSDANAEATPWGVTVAALEAAELAWLVTLRRDGTPHSTPVVPVWVEDAMHFTTGATEQKGKNLRGNDRVLLQVGRLDFERGIDVVIEGRAALARDPDLLPRLAAAWRQRWHGNWTYEARGDQLFHPGGFAVDTYSVRPDRAFAFTEGTFSHTRYVFPN